MRVYLDNAATTPVDPLVFEAMTPFLTQHFGNPSSTHAHGREARGEIEKSRKLIADLLNCSPTEIFFTSGGTEADNAIIKGGIDTFEIQNVLTTRIEHHAVLHTVEELEKEGRIQLHFLDVDELGRIDSSQLESLLKENSKTLVTLMHANNEIGTLHPIEQIGQMCQQYGAFFHSDTVQAIGHYKHDLKTLPIQGMNASAHKFHGPKGVGFMYLNKDSRIEPLIIGGGQERDMRGGTENVAGIAGLAKAMEIAYENMEEHHAYIQSLKDRMVEKITSSIDGVKFNGDLSNSLYTVLNVSLPPSNAGEMLLFDLDLRGISASGGSACAAGANTGSHVLTALGVDSDRGAVRFSFSKNNTPEEIDFAATQLSEIYQVKA
jgi:cysteine desulfurase